MKHFSIALINLPLLALGTALAQTPTAVDYDDMLSPLKRGLNRHPGASPEWTWMTEGQAALVLKAHGYDFIINLERAGQFWRGKAMREGASYHVAINRYAEVSGHMDQKALLLQLSGLKSSKTFCNHGGDVERPCHGLHFARGPDGTNARQARCHRNGGGWVDMDVRRTSHPNFEGQRLYQHRHPQARRDGHMAHEGSEGWLGVARRRRCLCQCAS